MSDSFDWPSGLFGAASKFMTVCAKGIFWGSATSPESMSRAWEEPASRYMKGASAVEHGFSRKMKLVELYG
jgi:hypothetical protein